MPHMGRPRIDAAFRLRDQYLALMLKHQSPNESFGGIERRLSGREFQRREGGSNGYNQPQCVARAARGEGMLSAEVIRHALRDIPGFEEVFASAFWAVLAREATGYGVAWLAQSGLIAGPLGRCWDSDGQLLAAPAALIRRAGRLTHLDALAILIAKQLREPFAGGFVESYAVDVFRRLWDEARAASTHGTFEHPFVALADSLDRQITKRAPGWRLLEKASRRLPMIRSRPPASLAEKFERDERARRALHRAQAKQRKRAS